VCLVASFVKAVRRQRGGGPHGAHLHHHRHPRTLDLRRRDRPACPDALAPPPPPARQSFLIFDQQHPSREGRVFWFRASSSRRACVLLQAAASLRTCSRNCSAMGMARRGTAACRTTVAFRICRADRCKTTRCHPLGGRRGRESRGLPAPTNIGRRA